MSLAGIELDFELHANWKLRSLVQVLAPEACLSMCRSAQVGFSYQGF